MRIHQAIWSVAKAIGTPFIAVVKTLLDSLIKISVVMATVFGPGLMLAITGISLAAQGLILVLTPLFGIFKAIAHLGFVAFLGDAAIALIRLGSVMDNAYTTGFKLRVALESLTYTWRDEEHLIGVLWRAFKDLKVVMKGTGKVSESLGGHFKALNKAMINLITPMKYFERGQLFLKNLLYVFTGKKNWSKETSNLAAKLKEEYEAANKVNRSWKEFGKTISKTAQFWRGFTRHGDEARKMTAEMNKHVAEANAAGLKNAETAFKATGFWARFGSTLGKVGKIIGSVAKILWKIIKPMLSIVGITRTTVGLVTRWTVKLMPLIRTLFALYYVFKLVIKPFTRFLDGLKGGSEAARQLDQDLERLRNTGSVVEDSTSDLNKKLKDYNLLTEEGRKERRKALEAEHGYANALSAVGNVLLGVIGFGPGIPEFGRAGEQLREETLRVALRFEQLRQEATRTMIVLNDRNMFDEFDTKAPIEKLESLTDALFVLQQQATNGGKLGFDETTEIYKKLPQYMKDALAKVPDDSVKQAKLIVTNIKRALKQAMPQGGLVQPHDSASIKQFLNYYGTLRKLGVEPFSDELKTLGTRQEKLTRQITAKTDELNKIIDDTFKRQLNAQERLAIIEGQTPERLEASANALEGLRATQEELLHLKEDQVELDLYMYQVEQRYVEAKMGLVQFEAEAASMAAVRTITNTEQLHDALLGIQHAAAMGTLKTFQEMEHVTKQTWSAVMGDATNSLTSMRDEIEQTTRRINNVRMAAVHSASRFMAHSRSLFDKTMSPSILMNEFKKESDVLAAAMDNASDEATRQQVIQQTIDLVMKYQDEAKKLDQHWVAGTTIDEKLQFNAWYTGELQKQLSDYQQQQQKGFKEEETLFEARKKSIITNLGELKSYIETTLAAMNDRIIHNSLEWVEKLLTHLRGVKEEAVEAAGAMGLIEEGMNKIAEGADDMPSLSAEEMMEKAERQFSGGQISYPQYMKDTGQSEWSLARGEITEDLTAVGRELNNVFGTGMLQAVAAGFDLLGDSLDEFLIRTTGTGLQAPPLDPDLMSASRGTTRGFASGGMINHGSVGRDKVPIMATKGEFVVNKKSSQNHINLLHAINSSRKFYHGGIVGMIKMGRDFQAVQGYADGGTVGPPNPIHGIAGGAGAMTNIQEQLTKIWQDLQMGSNEAVRETVTATLVGYHDTLKAGISNAQTSIEAESALASLAALSDDAAEIYRDYMRKRYEYQLQYATLEETDKIALLDRLRQLDLDDLNAKIARDLEYREMNLDDTEAYYQKELAANAGNTNKEIEIRERLTDVRKQKNKKDINDHTKQAKKFMAIGHQMGAQLGKDIVSGASFGDAMKGVFQNLASSVFSSLMENIQKNILEKIKNKAVGGLFESVLSGFTGGMGGSLIGAIGMQHGGIVRKPILAAIGENKRTSPEVVTPLKQLPGLIGEALGKSGMGGGGVTIHAPLSMQSAFNVVDATTVDVMVNDMLGPKIEQYLRNSQLLGRGFVEANEFMVS